MDALERPHMRSGVVILAAGTDPRTAERTGDLISLWLSGFSISVLAADGSGSEQTAEPVDDAAGELGEYLTR
jgi:hypothetical protein